MTRLFFPRSKEEEVRDLLWADGMGLQRALPRCRARSRGLQVCAVLSRGPCSRHPAARGTCRIPSLPGRRVLKSPMLHVSVWGETGIMHRNAAREIALSCSQILQRVCSHCL